VESVAVTLSSTSRFQAEFGDRPRFPSRLEISDQSDCAPLGWIDRASSDPADRLNSNWSRSLLSIQLNSSVPVELAGEVSILNHHVSARTETGDKDGTNSIFSLTTGFRAS
jgi:hypothetical protein